MYFGVFARTASRFSGPLSAYLVVLFLFVYLELTRAPSGSQANHGAENRHCAATQGEGAITLVQLIVRTVTLTRKHAPIHAAMPARALTKGHCHCICCLHQQSNL
jgi:hypothetical protein